MFGPAGAHLAGRCARRIGVEIDLRRVFIAYRAPYRYIVYELQERGCELVELGFES